MRGKGRGCESREMGRGRTLAAEIYPKIKQNKRERGEVSEGTKRRERI